MRSCFYFSVLQSPIFRMQLITGNSILQPISYASIWFDYFRNIGTTRARNSVKPVRSKTNSDSREELEPGLLADETKGLSGRLKWVDDTNRLSGRFKQQEITTKVYTRKNNIQRSKPGTVSPDELVDGVIQRKMNKSEVKQSEGIRYCDVQEKIECKAVPIIVIDFETTGLSRKTDLIVEIAMRNLNGGENSTFQTLVNPGCDVPNTHVHGISTDMVKRPEVPRFKELIPILLQFLQSQQIPNTPILFVAHNARCFDVPFLINEFSRCSEDIPSDWHFLDTLSLARELAKLEGTKNLPGKSLQALREHYGIPLVGQAHRAMSDVNTLSSILREMTIDLKLPVSGLLERSFKASDIVNVKKKKKSTS